MAAFQGNPTGTVSITVSASSQSQQIQTQQSNNSVRVANDGVATVFVAFGGSAVTATLTASIPILAGTVEVFRLPATHVAAIGTGATGTIYFTPGEGE